MRKHVDVSRDDGRVATITLSNPPYNLVTRLMTEELDAAMAMLERDSTVGAIVITSDTPGIFLSHYDVAEILEMGEALKLQLPAPILKFSFGLESALAWIPGFRRAMRPTMLGGLGALNLYHSVTRRIRTSSKPVIAAINGRAMGGGCELALACDFRIMLSTSFEGGVVTGQPEIVVGIIPGGGGTQMLSRMVGSAKALELCLEGMPFTAKEAVKLGLVTKAVESEAELREETMKLARRMANRSPQAVRAIKMAIHDGGSRPLETGLLVEMAGFAAAAGSRAAQSGMRQYVHSVDEVLGQDVTIESLQPWLEGTKINLTSQSDHPADRSPSHNSRNVRSR